MTTIILSVSAPKNINNNLRIFKIKKTIIKIKGSIITIIIIISIIWGHNNNNNNYKIYKAP